MKKPKSKAPGRRQTNGSNSDLAKRVVEGLENSPEAARELIGVVEQETSMMFAGPLPPPQILAGYEDALPGAADRVISMAESNNAANQGFANASMRNELIYKLAGMACGIAALLALIGGAVYCAAIGQPTVSYALVGVGAFSTISVFVNAWIKGKNDKNE